MNREEYISYKIKKLKEEGYSSAQSAAIAYSMEKDRNKAQQGGQYPSPYAMTYPSIVNNFTSTPYVGKPEIPQYDFNGSPFTSQSATPATNYLDSQYQFSGQDLNLTEQQRQQLTNQIAGNQPQYNDITRYNIVNPYSGVDLESSLNYAGQGFGSGNNFQGGLGAGLSVLKGARSFLTGYASGKESDRVRKEQFNDIYNPKINYQYAQEGGTYWLDFDLAGQKKDFNTFNKPDNIHIKDNRTKRATTNKPINPNKDLITGNYPTQRFNEVIEIAKGRGMSREDIDRLAAIAMAETGMGKADSNIGRVLNYAGDAQGFVDAYQEKMNTANRLNLKKEEDKIQVYNGRGKVFSNTEKNEHGFNMQKIYGVPIPEEGIDMKKNPLYGKNVLDIENVLKSNPEYNNYINSYYNPFTAMQQGGEIKNSDVLTGKYLTDQVMPNYNVESGEFVKKADTGNVQEVVGEKHIKNGKIGEGVDVRLDGGDKVLSDYTKIPAKNIKELKERYDLKLKKGATFSDAQKQYDKKLGIQKETDFLSGLIEKFGKNSNIEDETTRRLNEIALSKEIETSKAKLDMLSNPQSMVFDDLFSIQESIPKKGDGTQIFDENGKEVAQQGKNYQQGGEISNIAAKYGISEERAQELLAMQEGGTPEQPTSSDQEQIMNFIAQALSQGSSPEEVLKELVSQGIDQNTATQMVQGVMQQLQQPAEGDVPMAQEGTQAGFSFSTRYTPTIPGYDVSGNSIVNQDMLQNVEQTQPFTGTGYGAQMRNVEDTINLHKWYFDTEAKKQAFRDAVKKEGQQPEILKFQNAYNKELRKRAEEAGISKTETNNIINQVGFSGRGVQQFDGKFGAFSSTRPLYDFKKANGDEIKVEEKVVVDGKPVVEQRNIIKNVLPLLPDDLRLAPSALDPLYKEQITLGRLDPTKQTVEPYLAEQERQRGTDVARVQASGLPPQAQEALLSQGLASSQMASNDAISKIESFNAQNQAQIDQYNLGQRSKEDLTNSQFNQQYEQQVLGGLNNYENNWRSYYNEQNLQNRQNYKDIENINMINSQNENFQYVPGVGLQYINTPKTNLALPSLNENAYLSMTPEQIDAYKKSQIAKSRLQGTKII